MAKTVEEGFELFLKRLIPTATEHNKVTKHKKTVHRCLKNKLKCKKFFDIGSYGNGTGIRHHSDTDYFAVLTSNILPSDSSKALRETGVHQKVWGKHILFQENQFDIAY